MTLLFNSLSTTRAETLHRGYTVTFVMSDLVQVTCVVATIV